MKTTMGIGMRTMNNNTLYNNNKNYKTIYNNFNERHYTLQDDEMANTIFFDGNNNKKEERIYNKEERHKFYRDYLIEKKLTYDEFHEIQKNLRKKK